MFLENLHSKPNQKIPYTPNFNNIKHTKIMYKYSFIHGQLYFQGLVDFYFIKNPTCICVDECLYFDCEVYYND